MVRLVDDLLDVSRSPGASRSSAGSGSTWRPSSSRAVETSRPASRRPATADVAAAGAACWRPTRPGWRRCWQPAQQRRQVHRAGRPDLAGRRAGRAGRGPRPGPGHRHRHRPGHARPGVRPVRPGRPVAGHESGRARGRGCIVSMGQHRRLAIFGVLEAIFILAAEDFAVARGRGLEGVAICVGAAAFVFRGVLQIQYGCSLIGLPVVDYLRAVFVRTTLVGAGPLAALAIMQAWLPPTTWLLLLIESAVYALLYWALMARRFPKAFIWTGKEAAPADGTSHIRDGYESGLTGGSRREQRVATGR